MPASPSGMSGHKPAEDLGILILEQAGATDVSIGQNETGDLASLVGSFRSHEIQALVVPVAGAGEPVGEVVKLEKGTGQFMSASADSFLQVRCGGYALNLLVRSRAPSKVSRDETIRLAGGVVSAAACEN